MWQRKYAFNNGTDLTGVTDLASIQLEDTVSTRVNGVKKVGVLANLTCMRVHPLTAGNVQDFEDPTSQNNNHMALEACQLTTR